LFEVESASLRAVDVHAILKPIKESGVIEKHESRRIRNEIRRALLTVWDSIGVKDEPNAVDPEKSRFLADKPGSE